MSRAVLKENRCVLLLSRSHWRAARVTSSEMRTRFEIVSFWFSWKTRRSSAMSQRTTTHLHACTSNRDIMGLIRPDTLTEISYHHRLYYKRKAFEAEGKRGIKLCDDRDLCCLWKKQAEKRVARMRVKAEVQTLIKNKFMFV